MNLINIYTPNNPWLEIHRDTRGQISDVFYDTEINHVAVVTSVEGAIRGNHYHKESTQHMLMTQGSMEYWWKPVYSDEPAQRVIVREGDLVSTPPYEVHTLRFLEEWNAFTVFTQGIRGGMDYEADTFRVDSILP